jgi:hypothetical protein
MIIKVDYKKPTGNRQRAIINNKKGITNKSELPKRNNNTITLVLTFSFKIIIKKSEEEQKKKKNNITNF